MDDVAIVSAGMVPCRSRWPEKALRELPQVTITEACVSGLCDICLYQAGLCNIVCLYQPGNIVGPHREDSHLSRRPDK